MKQLKNPLLALLLAAPTLAGAAGFDGKTPLVCATLEAVQCAKAPGETHVCARGNAVALNVPQFLKLDFAAKRVTATEETGVSSTSSIADVTFTKDHLVVQGHDEGHGWVVMVDPDTGRMTATAIGHDEGLLVFGACTAP